MMHRLLSALDSRKPLARVSAHCDVPCAIYDPSTAQLAALSVIRFLDQIAELDGPMSLADQAKLSRLVREKEKHAAKVKDEVRVIWGDYFKQPQFEKYPNSHELVHQIMLAGSACKQQIDRANGEKLLELVNEFAESFWATKDIETYRATCPYPPSETVVYPKLS